ncbi:MAG: DUF5131 family protein [Alphaproteobacteria bacterium]|nr:MAG: DUF5131 family protein [Alphaproteobacteria bacterium]
MAPLGPVDIDKANCLPDWIICGGDSGGGARVMDPAWARHVRDQYRALGIAFFLKQWGTYRSNSWCRRMGSRWPTRRTVTRAPTVRAAPCSMAACIAIFQASRRSSERECPLSWLDR